MEICVCMLLTSPSTAFPSERDATRWGEIYDHSNLLTKYIKNIYIYIYSRLIYNINEHHRFQLKNLDWWIIDPSYLIYKYFIFIFIFQYQSYYTLHFTIHKFLYLSNLLSLFSNRNIFFNKKLENMFIYWK